MMKQLLTIIAASFLFVSCGDTSTEQKEEAPEKTKLDQVSWLLGTWEMGFPDGHFSESWEQLNDTMLSGEGSMHSAEGQLMFTETLQLILDGGNLYYVPSISNQNEGKPIPFKEKEFTGDRVVFENLEHDFPQRIVYEKQTDSTVLAYIEGEVDGEMKKEEYPYTRAK